MIKAIIFDFDGYDYRHRNYLIPVLERDLGLSPFEAVSIEDSPNGVKSAKAAGIFCIKVPGPITKTLAFENADVSIPPLADFSFDAMLRSFSDRAG